MEKHRRDRALACLLLSATAIAAAIPEQVHPDFDLRAIPLANNYKTTGIGFLSDGRMVLATTTYAQDGTVPPLDPAQKIYVLSNYGSLNAGDIQVKEISNTWHQPIGVTIADDKAYVSDRDGFYQILDLDNPADLAGNRKLIATWPDENHWNAGFSWHQWVFTPMYYKGFFWAPYSGSIRPGGPSDVPATTSYSGAFLKWDLSGTLTKVAGGLRSPNGANLNPAGEMFVADNQGSWLPSSTFMLMKEGKFYGHRQSPTRDSTGAIIKDNGTNWAEGLPYERPTAWLDHGNVRSSPSQPVYVPAGRYAGDWLLGDVNNPGLVRIALDNVDGTYNGSVFWFSKGFGAAAINRMAWGPDSALYIGTIMKIGNWPSGDNAPIYRLSRKAAETSFDFRMVRSMSDGLELIFSGPVYKNTVAAGDFTVQQWYYQRQEGYGAGKSLPVTKFVTNAEVSADGTRVHLTIPGLAEDNVVYIKVANVLSASQAKLWNDEAWFTLNKIATRTWDLNSAVKETPVLPSLEGYVRWRFAGQGLEVSLDSKGPHTAALRTLAGSELRKVSGQGFGPTVVPVAGLPDGVYLLDVRQGGRALLRPVTLAR